MTAARAAGLPGPLVASHLLCLPARSKGLEQIPTPQICPELFSSYILPSSSPNLNAQRAVCLAGCASASEGCLSSSPKQGDLVSWGNLPVPVPELQLA